MEFLHPRWRCQQGLQVYCFSEGEALLLVCTHASLRFAYDNIAFIRLQDCQRQLN